MRAMRLSEIFGDNYVYIGEFGKQQLSCPSMISGLQQ